MAEQYAGIDPASHRPKLRLASAGSAPIPRAVRLQGPSVLASRLPGSSDAAISASMLFVRNRWDTKRISDLGFRISVAYGPHPASGSANVCAGPVPLA